MTLRIHRWATREGNRGIRSFVTATTRGGEGSKVLSARMEGYVFSGASHTGVGLQTDDDTAGVQLFVGLSHVACGWFTAGSPALSRWAYRRWNKSLPEVDIAKVQYHDRAVWWSFWHNKWGWTKGTPRWRHGSWHWWDWLAGRPAYTSVVVEGPVSVQIPMPEGNYPAEVTLTRDSWKRPRWPWPLVRRRYNVAMVPGPDGKAGYVPVPGKDENSWDCGPDGIFAQTGVGTTVEEAIGGVVSSALRDRRRYAGRHDYADPIT